jgi:O-methyltransferase
MKWIQGFNYLFGSLFNYHKTVITKSLNYTDKKRKLDRNYLDYIRLASLELAAEEVNQKQLDGAVAELGVYKGKFARYINQYFPERKLYLFDTFEGFNNSDIAVEKNNNFSTGSQDFTNTSVDEVLGLMPHPNQCIIKKGFFPSTAEGLIEPYVFVSIDADLYEPIYKGLHYFYPLLKKGGFIFVHDYNNDEYKGAKKAVAEFCKENNITAMPLPDACGTVVIVK